MTRTPPRPIPELAAAQAVLSALDNAGIRACVFGIVRRQGDHLDVDVVRRWGRMFAELKEDPDLLRPFEQTLRSTQ